MWTTTIETPIGILRAVADDEGLRCLLWPGLDPSHYRLPERAIPLAERPIFTRLREQLAQYFAGTRTSFDLPLAPKGTAFQRAAWEALRTIPYGATRTYAQQAEAIGRPRAVRAIGAANARNPISIVVPCHRVVGHDGSLTGFAGGLHAKRFLLEHEARGLDTLALEPVPQGV